MRPRRTRDETPTIRALGAFAGLARRDDRWERTPPSFGEFVTSPRYLGLPPLSTRQRQAFAAFFEHDGAELFDRARNRYNEAILIWGKGSGKDYLSSIAIAYLAYVLLCLRDPATALGLAPGESLDIVNVATRAEQARDVFFAKLQARLRRPCFEPFQPRIGLAKAEFPGKGVRLVSLHSKEQKWEGYNLIGWVMDEADAFATAIDGNSVADSVYKVLSSSAVSRFPDRRWIGIVISYPRSRTGWLLQHAERMAAHDLAYIDRAATWEVHPHYDPEHPDYKGFPWVVVHDRYRVPEPFAAEFLADPTGSATAYMCDPPQSEDAFIEFSERIDDCADPTLVQAYEAKPTTTVRTVGMGAGFDATTGLYGERTEAREYVAIALGERRLEPVPGARYYIHADPGETNDSFALALAHALPETVTVEQFGVGEVTVNRVIVDLLLEWRPQPGRPVDALNAADVIARLCHDFPVEQVTFDKFQSAAAMQLLQQRGVNARQLAFSRPEQLAFYRALKSAIYHRTIRWPEEVHPRLFEQLAGLKLRNGQITHDVAGKDLADAVAAVHYLASGAGMSAIARQIAETIGQSGGAGTTTGVLRTRWK